MACKQRGVSRGCPACTIASRRRRYTITTFELKLWLLSYAVKFYTPNETNLLLLKTANLNGLGLDIFAVQWYCGYIGPIQWEN